MDESDPALRHFVGELELIENLELIDGFELRFFPGIERVRSNIRIRVAHLSVVFVRRSS